MNLTKCRVCGEGYEIDCEDEVDIEFNSVRGKVTSYYKQCDRCDSVFATAEDMSDNKSAVLDFRTKVLRTLRCEE
jgi:hypothetical protein